MKFNKTIASFRKKNQEGITLLLSILMLAAIMAISFSLTTILFIELRSSSDLLKSEASLYGATGIGEQALFNLKRQACLNSPTCYISDYNNNVVLNGEPQQVTVNNPIINDKVAAGSTFANTQKKFELCGTNPTYDANGNVEGCNYGKISVNYVVSNNSTDALNFYLCQWDPNTNYLGSIPCSIADRAQTYWRGPDACYGSNSCLLSDGSYSLTPTINTATWTLDPTKQQELIVTNPNGTGDVYFSIATYDTDNITPKGMPYIGSTAVDVSTINGSVGRKIQVNVPNAELTAQSQPTFVQAAEGTNYVGAPSFTVPFTSKVSTGDTIIVGFVWSDSNWPPSVSDSLGDFFTKTGDFGGIYTFNPGPHYYWFVAPVTNVNGGNDTLTFTSVNGYVTGLWMAEYSGLQTTPFDTANSSYDTASPCDTGSITPGSDGELIIGAFYDTGSISPGFGFTQRVAPTNLAFMEDQIDSNPGSIDATAPCNATSGGPAFGSIEGFKRK